MAITSDLERVVVNRSDYFFGQRLRKPFAAPVVGNLNLANLATPPAARPVYGVAIDPESEVRGVTFGGNGGTTFYLREEPVVSTELALASSAAALLLDRLDVTDGQLILWLAYTPQAAALLRPTPVRAYTRVVVSLTAAQIAAGIAAAAIDTWVQAPRAQGIGSQAVAPGPMRVSMRYNLTAGAGIAAVTSYFEYDASARAPGGTALPFNWAGFALAAGNAAVGEAIAAGLDLWRIRIPITAATGNLDMGIYVARC